MQDKQQPIIIKRVKRGGHAHHGGAWKVAYADFVTAMMAFFLLMWLLGSTSKSQREGIADWFQEPTGIQGPGGASTSMIKLGGALELPRTPAVPQPEHVARDQHSKPVQAEEAAADKRRLDQLLQELKASIEQSQALKPFKDQLLLDITPEGLRIQIVDKENRPMFAVGEAELKSYTRKILIEIAHTIDEVPNKISITGHTDARQYLSGRRDYGNWELSADRANAARRALVEGGMVPGKIGRVVGLASSVLFDKQDPYSPINRRISIIVMNKATERSIGLSEGGVAKTPAASAGPAAGPH